MYRLIIVDDEAIIREGIASRINWKENGFELTAALEHGQEALSYIEKNPVDVVISDINMPRMDGLTLSRILAERFPQILVLLLTGYDDFEYAQEAIKNQVREFLLKPITAEELKEVLLRVRAQLDRVRDRERQQELMKEKLTLSFPLLKERFLYRLVSGRLDRENINRRKAFFQWNDLEKFYCVLVIAAPPLWDELDTITLTEFLRGEILTQDEIFLNREENIVLLLQGGEEHPLGFRARTMAEKAFREAAREGKEQISAGLGEVVSRLELLQSSYRGACTVLDHCRVTGLSQILSIEEIERQEKISRQTYNALTKNLTDQLTEGRRAQTEASLEEIFRYLEAHYLSPGEAAYFLNRLYFHLLYFLRDRSLLTEDEPFPEPVPGSFTSLTQAREFFFRQLGLLEDRIHDRRHSAVLSRVDRARQIIAQKFGDSRFSLQDICNDLYLSVSQFSMIFKEGTGRTFVEYLTAHRVEEAKMLLKTTDMKSYEVAEKIGYPDPRYFSLIFKKLTGLTPMEFRRSLEL